jgi:hypothetical protein
MQSLESISRLQLPPHVDSRLKNLMNRHAAGTLSESEKHELDVLVAANQTLSMVRAKARNLLESTPAEAGKVTRTVRNGLPVFVVPTSTPKIDADSVRRCLRENGF